MTKSISLGFAAEQNLNNLKQKDVITGQKMDEFNRFSVWVTSC